MRVARVGGRPGAVGLFSGAACLGLLLSGCGPDSTAASPPESRTSAPATPSAASTTAAADSAPVTCADLTWYLPLCPSENRPWLSGTLEQSGAMDSPRKVYLGSANTARGEKRVPPMILGTLTISMDPPPAVPAESTDFAAACDLTSKGVISITAERSTMTVRGDDNGRVCNGFGSDDVTNPSKGTSVIYTAAVQWNEGGYEVTVVLERSLVESLDGGVVRESPLPATEIVSGADLAGAVDEWSWSAS